MTLTEFITGIRGRLAAATPGPWWLGYWAGQCHIHHKDEDGKFTPAHPGREQCKYEYTRVTDNEHFADTVSAAEENVQLIDHAERNAALIASAPTDLALAVEMIEVMREALTETSRSICKPISMTDANMQLSKIEIRCDQALAKIDALLKGSGNG